MFFKKTPSFILASALFLNACGSLHSKGINSDTLGAKVNVTSNVDTNMSAGKTSAEIEADKVKAIRAAQQEIAENKKRMQGINDGYKAEAKAAGENARAARAAALAKTGPAAPVDNTPMTNEEALANIRAKDAYSKTLAKMRAWLNR